MVAEVAPVVAEVAPVVQQPELNDPVVTQGYANAIANVPVEDPTRPLRRKKS